MPVKHLDHHRMTHRWFTEAASGDRFGAVLTNIPNDLAELLAESRASDAFKADVIRFLTAGSADRLNVRGFAPRVKVARLIKHMLANHPELDIEHVALEGQSGCSDFAGTVRVATSSETRVFDFVWCCRWRAEQEGWVDYFGFPDQMRAAREYDWRCFRVWQEQ
jgi:hypothetical protein